MFKRFASAFGMLNVIMGAALVVSGCNRTEAPAPATPSAASPSSDAGHADDHGADSGSSDHAHEPGAHGGAIVPIGRDSYHAEVVFETGGKIRLLTLGADETKIQEIESQSVTAYAKPAGGMDAVPVEFVSEPQPGDAQGTTSQLVAQLPELLLGQNVEVTIPNIRIGGERFRLGFSSPATQHDEHGAESMPEKAVDADEASLYLTPGGKYTAADIAANGHQTASEKFRGVKAAHDLNPQPGDKICPITLTKANPKFAWIVGGQSYEFCCPPCVDEFVRLAKEEPDQISDANSYVRR